MGSDESLEQIDNSVWHVELARIGTDFHQKINFELASFNHELWNDESEVKPRKSEIECC